MKDLANKKLYSIVRTNLGSKALAMYTASKVMAKLDGVTHQAKPPEKPESMRKK